MGMISAKPLYTLSIKAISEVKGQPLLRHLRFISIVTFKNYFLTYYFQKPLGQFSLNLYILLIMSHQSPLILI